METFSHILYGDLNHAFKLYKSLSLYLTPLRTIHRSDTEKLHFLILHG